MTGHARTPAAIAITGPTTSGKTELSLALARALGGEIISMDSRQVYRGMDIGTDKVTADDRARVPHFGLDLVNPDERYSAGQFARDARRWVGEIRGRGRVPILAGGTGFFLNAVLRPLFDEPPMDMARRDALRSWLAGLPRDELAEWVRALDPARAPLAIEGGPQRMTRTAEVPLLTGHPLSWWHHAARAKAPGVHCLVVILELDRERLDERIDARVDEMVNRGLLDEVRGLLEAGYQASDPGMTGTGYRELVATLRGEMPLEEALERMRLQTRQYARRQITWFRHQAPEDAISLPADLPLAQRVQQVVAAWHASQNGPEHTS